MLAAVLVIAAGGLSGCGGQGDEKANDRSGGDDPSSAGIGEAVSSRQDTSSGGSQQGAAFDFVHRGTGALLVPTPDGPGSHSLELVGVEPSGVAFSDRPEHVASPVDPAATFTLLDVPQSGDTEAADPPNAALVPSTGPTVVFEVLQAKYDPDTSTYRLAVELLEYDGEPAAFAADGRAVPVPEDFGPASLFIDASLGARSIRVMVANDSNASLTVQAVEVVGGEWIEGMQPQQGQTLEPFQSVSWGVDTDDYDDSITASLVLTGDGEPISVQMEMTAQDRADVQVQEQRATVTQVDTGELDHGVFQVTLTDPDG